MTKALKLKAILYRTQCRNKAIDHYVIGKTIGEGTFGKVRSGTHILTGKKVAVKILEKDRISDVADVERVSREIHILKLTRHANIIQLYEIIETQKQLYLIMEYANGGELFDYIVNNSRLDEMEACHIFQQIISGIEYIHKLKVVHRDMKPENLLIDNEKTIKIVDFGLSNTYNDTELLKTACGSPCYAAPEMIAGKKYVGPKADLWSCGVILYALVCGFLPFEDNNTASLYKKIMEGDYVVPDFISEEARDLIVGILEIDPEKRFSVDQIKSHPWFGLSLPMYSCDGLIVGYNRIPIEEEILHKMNKQGFDPKYIERCLDANKHNHTTTTYYLNYKNSHFEDKLEVIKNAVAETRQASDEKSRNIKDPAANIIDEYLVDDMSDESFLRPDSTRNEEQKTAGQTDKIAQIYKAINQSFERSRVGNTRQFQSENKHYENSKITLQLQNTYTKLNEEQSDKMNYSNIKTDEACMFKSNVHTLDHTLDCQNPDLSRLSKNGVDTSLVTYDPQNLTEIPNLAYDYLNNISGYDLISDDQNSVISSENENEIGQGKLKKEKVIPVYSSSKDNSQKRFVLNKKLLSSYQRKTPKGNTALGHYNVKMNPVSSKSRKNNSSTKLPKNSSAFVYNDKGKQLHKSISQKLREHQSSKSKSGSRRMHGLNHSKGKKHTTSKNSKSSMFNLVTSSCNKALKKLRKSKSPGISKTRAPTRCSPYKQSLSKNSGLYKHSYDGSVKKPVTNRNAAIYSKGRKCLINTTFCNEDKNKISQPRQSVPKEYKFTDRLKLDKKLKNYIKQTDGFLNLYANSKKTKNKDSGNCMILNSEITQAPTTVNNNACIIVNQSIVLPKSKKKVDGVFDQYKKVNSSYTAFNSKKGSKDGLRNRSRHGSTHKKRSPKVDKGHQNLLQLHGKLFDPKSLRQSISNSHTVRSQTRTRNKKDGVHADFYTSNPHTNKLKKAKVCVPNLNLIPSAGALPGQSKFLTSQSLQKVIPQSYCSKSSQKRSQERTQKHTSGKAKIRVKRSHKASFSEKKC